MFSSTGFLVILLLSLLVFAVPESWKYYLTLGLIIAGIALTTAWSAGVMSGAAQNREIPLLIPSAGTRIVLVIDSLSAFFILVINITVLTGFLYARGYLEPYKQRMNALRFSIHYFSYLWLWLSMLMVVMIRDGLSFLIVWEIMALSSFLLVIFDAGERSILKTGISYLIQMHAGMFFILVAFLLVHKATGQMSFDALDRFFSSYRNLPLFLLFFAGFAIKAGFIPLHTWLPEAHPAAPSHVSGVMSGVMIKMGIYGIIRVLVSMQSDLLITGVIILLVSLLSGVMGVMMAIVQHDLKRLLAYHSIENIGIIGIGVGLGVIGLAVGSQTLALLGFAGGVLHVLNHSLFKSLLFFNAGSVYHSAHTRNLEQTGGLMKRMPWTALLFLTGSLAICGLPPFNGFISEYLIYMGMFNSLPGASLNHSILIVGSIAALSLIGGLAIFCFTKAFGIVFLGEPRSDSARNASEVSKSMIIPQFITVALMLVIGLSSPLAVKPVFGIVSRTWDIGALSMVSGAFITNLWQISLAGGIFVFSLAALLLYRRYHLGRRVVESGPTWGCGYTAVTPRQQYTATSFAYNYNHIAKPVLQTQKEIEEPGEEDIFPEKGRFVSHSDDLFKRNLIDKPVDMISGLLKKIAVMQTGQIRHYILYAFIFMLLVLLLAILNII
ncbi:MAG TPA: proton-conducting transporter membrane subunit [Bacteroidales bacterium]|jgi:formate hydrogenlyase subunit 3/multisubunit Na+/H+ antiporter MnhD subunit|nr:proton-conducting transporter membrane subunit [Bacteroidales bacterium]